MLLLPFKSGCMWLTDADCGTLGRAPVDVCSDVDVAFVLMPLQLLLVPQPAASSDVTVLLGAVTVPLLLRKCLKEKVDDDDVDEDVATPALVAQLLLDAVAVDAAFVVVIVVLLACGIARMFV